MWKVKQQNKQYLVYAEDKGSFTFNNRKDAERLCRKLNNMHDSINDAADKMIEQGKAWVNFGKLLKEMQYD